MDRDYSDRSASELTDRQASGFVYSWFLENTEKNQGIVRDFSEAHAPDCIITSLLHHYYIVIPNRKNR